MFLDFQKNSISVKKFDEQATFCQKSIVYMDQNDQKTIPCFQMCLMCRNYKLKKNTCIMSQNPYNITSLENWLTNQCLK